MPTCRKCGAAFAPSPAGTTVHCPLHRGRATGAAAAPTVRRITTCFCGKTVVAGPGVAPGTTCPRRCHP